MLEIAEERWMNEPPQFVRTDGLLEVVTGQETDFWNNTFYGFRHGNGHFLASTVRGDFALTLEFSANYGTLYDQAGAMLRVDDNNWLKCGVEFTEGRRQFSVVVTRDDQSDWSVMPLPGQTQAVVTLRLSRYADALRVEVRRGKKWHLVRLAYLRMEQQVDAGPMCCSPAGEGLRVRFQRIGWGAPPPRDSHA